MVVRERGDRCTLLVTIFTLCAGFKGGSNVLIEPHRHPGVFIARGKEDALVTKNLVPGEAVYGEKRISVDVCIVQIYVLCNHNINQHYMYAL